MKGANRSWGFGPAAAGRCEGNLCKKRYIMVLKQLSSCEASVGWAHTCLFERQRVG